VDVLDQPIRDLDRAGLVERVRTDRRGGGNGGCDGRDDDKAFPRSENHLLSLDHAGRVAYLEPFELERGARGAHSCSSSSTTRTWRLSGVM
jgi:hypothetical protein